MPTSHDNLHEGRVGELGQPARDLGLTAEGRADKHEAVTHQRRFVQLDNLQEPSSVEEELLTLHDGHVAVLNILIELLRGVSHFREQILQEGEEERDLWGGFRKKILGEFSRI